jgi:hypothetical protein
MHITKKHAALYEKLDCVLLNIGEKKFADFVNPYGPKTSKTPRSTVTKSLYAQDKIFFCKKEKYR